LEAIDLDGNVLVVVERTVGIVGVIRDVFIVRNAVLWNA